MRPDEVGAAPFDIFDDTFTWPHHDYPLRRVGRLTLNRNVRPMIIAYDKSVN